MTCVHDLEILLYSGEYIIGLLSGEAKIIPKFVVV